MATVKSNKSIKWYQKHKGQVAPTRKNNLWWRAFTSRLRVAVRLFSDRSQMTSKRGENKRRGTRVDSRVPIIEQTHGSMESTCFL